MRDKKNIIQTRLKTLPTEKRSFPGSNNENHDNSNIRHDNTNYNNDEDSYMTLVYGDAIIVFFKTTMVWKFTVRKPGSEGNVRNNIVRKKSVELSTMSYNELSIMSTMKKFCCVKARQKHNYRTSKCCWRFNITL